MTLNRTAIQWTDFTANPIRYKNADGLDVWACSKVSAGCTNCYAETLALSPRMVSKGRALGNKFNDAEMAKLTPYLDEEVLRKMLTFKPRGPFRNGERPMVFVGDMTDVFGPWVQDEWLDRLFAVFALRPDVTWQVLTKRPERMREYLCRHDIGLRWLDAANQFEDHGLGVGDAVNWTRRGLPNVWLGTSVEDQAAADSRIPELLAAPAAVRFLSCEPLLGPVDLASRPLTTGARLGAIDWVIAGGESGSGARPCDIAWLRSLRDQCAAAGVPYFAKQLGSKPRIWHEAKLADVHAGRDASQYHPLPMKHGHGGNPDEWPADLRRREWPLL